MAFLDHRASEVHFKIVIAGETACGKTEIARFLYDAAPESEKGAFQSVDTGGEPTVFFAVRVPGTLRGFRIRLHVYTLPAEPIYELFRKAILKGVDGIVLVARHAVPDPRGQAAELLKGANEPLSVPVVNLVYDPNGGTGDAVTRSKSSSRSSSVPIFEVTRESPLGACGALREITRLAACHLTEGVAASGDGVVLGNVFAAPPGATPPLTDGSLTGRPFHG